MVPVTSGTGWGAQVAAHDHRIVVDTLVVSGKLVGWNAIWLHVICIGMATGAGCGDGGGMNRRP